jgi:uncharacterized membrane protein
MSFIQRYKRFVLFFVVLLVATPLLTLKFGFVPSLLTGFDIAALAFIFVLIRSFSDDKAEEMRQRAAENEPDQHILIFVAMIVLGIIMVAVGLELTDSHGRDLALSGGTLLLAWTFGNTMFALHYAHAYYVKDDGKDSGRLQFPGDEPPVYWDFAYFAFVLGMTFQVSDVQIADRSLRKVALVHSILAFIFNIGVVALTVSLIGNALH